MYVCCTLTLYSFLRHFNDIMTFYLSRRSCCPPIKAWLAGMRCEANIENIDNSHAKMMG